MELIPNWKDAWKFASNIAIGVTGVYDALYANIASIQALMTPGQFAVFNTAMAVAAVVLRVIKQSIPVTPEVKEELAAHVEALPEKPSTTP